MRLDSCCSTHFDNSCCLHSFLIEKGCGSAAGALRERRFSYGAEVSAGAEVSSGGE